MNLGPILDAVQERTGLDPASLGPHAVRAAVGDRLRALGIDEYEYAVRLASDAAEFGRLVEGVVVPETWFFRGGDVFPHLAEVIRSATLGRPTPFRALSLPCSTGEEPYSLAVALTELGVARARYTIDAVDLCERSIAAAQVGAFPELSFRQTTADVRQRYFSPQARGAEIAHAIRAAVRFRVGNLLDPALLLWEKPFDLVFCRNLFIYFTPEARKRGLDALSRLVAPGGLLAVGHAEAISAAEKRFERAGPLGCFLYRRTEVRSS